MREESEVLIKVISLEEILYPLFSLMPISLLPHEDHA